jgi:hypothetical protein
MDADATSASAGVKYQWLGPLQGFPKTPDMPEHPIHVAVVRVADGKMVAPKGITQDGTLIHVSSSKKKHVSCLSRAVLTLLSSGRAPVLMAQGCWAMIYRGTVLQM